MVGELDQEKLVPVFEAGSEFEALSVQAFLEEEGLEAAIMDLQIPMLDGIAMVRDPRWGLVMVLERDESRARELVAAYLESMAAVARLAETGRDPDAGFDGGEEGCYDEEEREYD
ncbi:DUF2007 domain-containing protein [Candidatus Fermentibacterales bacterium]|nr:DUF2007 domain-containing protein [Candidatus Fermentibacterales bacterium]